MEIVVKTKCPKCGKYQNVVLSARKRCVYCRHRFLLFPKNRRARVYSIVQGTYEQYLVEMNKIYMKLEKKRERDAMLKRMRRIKLDHGG